MADASGFVCFFFFSSRRRHTRCYRDWSSDVCSSDLGSCLAPAGRAGEASAAPSRVITDVVGRLHTSLQAPVYTRTESISTETISVRAPGPFEAKPMGGYPTVTKRQTISENLVGTQFRSGRAWALLFGRLSLGWRFPAR